VTEGARRASRPLRERLRNGSLLAGVGLCLLILAHVAYYFPRVVDDVYISLRYAENLAKGHGAVFNPGERVEGYSSPAWMFIQAFGIACGFEAVTFTKIIGVACLIASAFGLREVTRRMYKIESWPSWIPAYACAASSYLIDWTVLGLETPFHIATLVLCPLAVSNAVDSPSLRSRALAVVAVVALGTARPESILYVVINIAAPFAFVRTRAAGVDLVRRLWPVAVIAGALLAALLALRFAYYGAVVPNTYFVKEAHGSFGLEKLAGLWTQGASVVEAVLYCGGTVLLVAYSIRRRALAPALTALACLYFTATVAVDWMPNLRHLLPVIVFAPLGWACLIDELRVSDYRSRVALAFCALGLVVVASADIATVDVRLSTIEHRNGWFVPKNRAKWSDTLMAYRRIEPPHITRMGTFDMGQISQCWPVLETSTEAIDQSWYAGRDIGAVGFYTGVRIFDTAGLVTREVSRSEAWGAGDARGEVPHELVQMMLAKRPLAADNFDGWQTALGRTPRLLAGYRVRVGSPVAPYGIVAADRTPPSRAEILRRYRAFVAKFPRLYHVQTLYGETMGAAVERRLRIVETGS
jgi:hypothetical protein